MFLTDELREAIHQLWDDLADFPASRTDEALRLLMQKLVEWLEADNVVWVGAARLAHGAAARRDLLYGWRALVVRHLRESPGFQALSRLAISQQDTDPVPTTKALAAGAGHLRVHRLHDGFIDLEKFRQTNHYRMVYQQSGITDRLFVGFPVNPDTESFILVDHCQPRARFSRADAKLVHYVMRGLKWFHRELLLSHGMLLAGASLSPTERSILHLLLTEKSEKEVAAELGQSPKTTHKYITEILRKYGVKGRTGLMALWLNRSG